MINVETLGQDELRGKLVLLRTNLISPGSTSMGIKFTLTLPTLSHLSHHGAKTLITVKSNYLASDALNEVADALRRTLKYFVGVVSTRGTTDIDSSLNELQNGGILLVDEAAAASLAFDFIVHDSFGSVNEDAGAVKNIAPCYAGIQLEKKLSQVNNLPLPVTIIMGDDPCSDKLNAVVTLLKTPGKVEKILVGGCLVQYFRRALGRSTGDFAVEDESRIELVQHILQLTQQHAIPLILAADALIVPTELVGEPSQHAQTGASDTQGALNMDYSSHAAIRLGLKRVSLSVAPSPPGPLFRPAREGQHASFDAIPSGFTCVDIGAKTISLFSNELINSNSILMCGTMGMCENSFARGTNCLLEMIAHCTEQGCVTVLCGDAIVSALEHLQHTMPCTQQQEPQETLQPVQDERKVPQGQDEKEAKLVSSDQPPQQPAPRELRYSLVSPGGCAVLCALAGLPLPGLDALHHVYLLWEGMACCNAAIFRC